MNALDNGVIITGLVLAVAEARNVKAPAGSGKNYDFWTQEVQVWTGNKATVCNMRADKAEDLPPLMNGVKRSFRVSNGRLRDGAIQYDVTPI